MPKMIVSLEGSVIKEIELTKERTTIGRRPYNDIVIDNLAVSGEHAVLLMQGDAVYLEDLNSTNGTYVNGKAVKKQPLVHEDQIEIGKYTIKFQHNPAAASYDKTMIYKPGSIPPPVAKPPAPAPAAAAPAPAPSAAQRAEAAAVGGGAASIRVMSGPASGREVPLVKVVTTLGKPGVSVASITQRGTGYMIALVEGTSPPMLNGNPVGSEPVQLANGDKIELAGTQMEYRQN